MLWQIELTHFHEHDCDLWLHRKGAAPSNKGLVVIPGSRGARTYLVQPTGDTERTAYSLAHGAGRQWHRTKAHRIGKERFPRAECLRTTALGSTVICDDKALLYEEHPDAYKDIDTVIADMAGLGVARTVAVFAPLLTYKCHGMPSDDAD